MGEKIQISFKVNSDVVSELDKALLEFKETTGIKPVRQDCIEEAMKDYTVKIRRQIELLKQKSPTE